MCILANLRDYHRISQHKHREIQVLATNTWWNIAIKAEFDYTPCYFSPLSEIQGSIELLENSLTYEGVQWRKMTECINAIDLVL